jgi:N-terminal acetyltransferase B complex non-catalytic subunit
MTDVQPADDVGLAAVHLLLCMWSSNKADESPLLQAVGCLQYIISKSPSSAVAKWLLARVARLAGSCHDEMQDCDS